MNIKRILAALLAALMLIPTMAACNSDTPDIPDTSVRDTTASGGADTDAPGETTTVETTTRETECHEIKDNLPANLTFDGRKFSIYTGLRVAHERYVMGKEESSGDVVNDAVWKRNSNVEARLNIKLHSDGYDYDYATIALPVSTLIQAGDSSYDIFLGQGSGISSLVAQKMFVNGYDLKHVDFEQPWWMTNFMDNISIGSDARYLLLSDFNTQAITYIRANFFNKKLYERIYGNPDELYRLALDGKFTIDHMNNLVAGAYVDLNGDGVSDLDDQLGMVCNGLYASTISFVYGSDVQFSSRDAEGIIKLSPVSEDAVKLMEVLCAFFNQRAICTKGSTDTTFAKGNALFIGNATLDTAGWKAIREMKDEFGLLPHPKFTEAQKEYRSLVHDQALLTAVSTASKNLDMVGAVLEALSAESYRRVTPAYFETALKMKYSRDSISSRMADLIKDSMITEFIYIYNSSLKNLGTFPQNVISSNNPGAYVSSATILIGAAEAKLADLIEVYKGK